MSAKTQRIRKYHRSISMGFRDLFTVLFLVTVICQQLVSAQQKTGTGLGFNVGRTQTTHNLPPEIVVKLMKDNGFDKIKLFEADPGMLEALAGSGIKAMVGIPNEMLERLAGDSKNAEEYVAKNISHYIQKKVDINYVGIGNEPMLTAYNGSFSKLVLPAVKNIHAALAKAGVDKNVKTTVPFNSDVFMAIDGIPSKADFRSENKDLMVSITKFLNDNNCPFTVNIYPYLAYYYNPNFPIEYAMFNDTYNAPLKDGNLQYYNATTAQFDAMVYTLENNGFSKMPVIIGEVGWPTDGASNADDKMAQRFMQGLVKFVTSGWGTPKRPNNPPETYIFSLFDENNKSNAPGNFERHWGVFKMDGSVKYKLDLGSGKTLTGAKGVKYLEKQWCVVKSGADESKLDASVKFACDRADCSSVQNVSSCSGLDAKGKASYAFNAYFQTMNQKKDNCDFDGLGTITKTDPSSGNCKFDIMVDISSDAKPQAMSSSSGSSNSSGPHGGKSSATKLASTLSWVSMLGGLFILGLSYLN